MVGAEPGALRERRVQRGGRVGNSEACGRERLVLRGRSRFLGKAPEILEEEIQHLPPELLVQVVPHVIM